MITRIVKLTISPGRMEDFMEAFETVKAAIRASPGCSFLALLRDSSDSRVVFTCSRWNHPNDLDNYLNSERFRNTWKTVKPMFDAPAAAWSLETVAEC